MSADLLERACNAAGPVLANVRADQLDDPTPCESWTVRELINHMVGAAGYFAATAETGEGPDLASVEAQDPAAGDFAATFAEHAKRALAAFRADGAMEKTMRPFFGEVPGSIFVMIATTDVFTHAWDLARATGQSTDLDPELAEQLLASARAMLPDSSRGPEPAMFGPVVEVPDDAPAADRLAGFLGRAAC